MARPFAVSRLAGWLVTLSTIALFAGSAFCGALLWMRRAPWHIASTVQGSLPTHCGPHSPVVYVHDRAAGTLWFPDRDYLLTLPEEIRGKVQIDRFPMPGRCFVFEDPVGGHGEHGTRYRLWDVMTNREVPIPEFSVDHWKESDDGKYILLMDLRWDHPRRFLVQALDGSVARELQFPAQPRPVDPPDWHQLRDSFDFSPRGKFLVERLPRENPVLKYRIHDMTSGKSRAVGQEFRGIFDDGGVLVARPALQSDAARQSVLCCIEFDSQQERWCAEFQGRELRLNRADPQFALVQTDDDVVHVLDAISGRRVSDLEPARDDRSVHTIHLLEGAPRPMLGSREVWDVATGRRMPFRKPSFYPLDFFPDGRRVLVSDYGGSAEIVDVDTGKSLFRFDDAAHRAQPIRYVRRSGDRVLMHKEKKWDEIEIWERRHPEGWKGHFHRPELYGAIFCGAAMLVLLFNRPSPAEPRPLE